MFSCIEIYQKKQSLLASQLISETYPPLRLTDNIKMAIELMIDADVMHLPVVQDGSYLGLISLKSLINIQKDQKTIADLRKDFLAISALPEQATEEVLNLIVGNRISLLPIVTEENQYTGALSRHRLLQVLIKWMGMEHPGGVIVFSMGYYDYELGEIARLAETNNAKILSSWVSEPDENMNLLVYIKFNLNDLTHIIATYERFGFQIAATFHKSEVNDLLEERLNALIHYLNI